MSARRKEEIRAILAAKDFDKLGKWINKTRAPLRKLFSLTYDTEMLICYRAIEATGITAEQIAKTDLEKVREFIRSLIWLMTEESGGIGWRAPETIAEICIKVPALLDEYAKLLPRFLNEESFVPSTLSAINKLKEFGWEG